MLCTRTALFFLLGIYLVVACDWFLADWQWWAVVVPVAIVMSIAEGIEQEIRGWR